MEIQMHIVLQNPPAGVHFGLQKGTGSKYQTEQIQFSGTDDLSFKFSVLIKGDSQTFPAPKFSGPFVQGTAPDHFVYIDIGTYAGHESIWGRRLKIPLRGITWDLINQIKNKPDLYLETHVPGKGKDGSPNCATVKPFYGWNLKLRRNI